MSKTNFFALGTGASMIRNRNFTNANMELADLGGYFRKKTETFFFKFKALEYLTTKHFVTGGFVGKFQAGRNIGAPCQTTISESVPGWIRWIGFFTSETGSIHYIRLII